MANAGNPKKEDEKVFLNTQIEEKKVVLNAENEGIVTENLAQNSPLSDDKTVKNKKRKLGTILGFDEIKGMFKRTKEQNKNVKKYAILGIIFALCSVALVYPCFYGGFAIINFIFNSFVANISTATAGNVVLIILIVPIVAIVLGSFAIALFLAPVGLALFSLILPIFQLIVNRKWWGFVALAFGILAIPLCVLIFTLLI